MVGCAMQPPPPALEILPPPPIPSPDSLPMSLEEQQTMIMHLLQVLSEKEAEINKLRARQQSVRLRAQKLSCVDLRLKLMSLRILPK